MARHYIDIYAIIGIFLMMVPIMAWIMILRTQYSTLKQGTLRVQILSTRTALFLPTYAIVIWLSLVFPSLYMLLEVPISVAEGKKLSVHIISTGLTQTL